jgi:hypothetical protein
MKKILLKALGVTLFGLLSFNAISQNLPELKRKDTVETAFPCYDTTELFKTLRVNYQEVPFIFGKADDLAQSTFSMWIGPKDKTFTLVATINNLSCVVGSGRDMKLVPKELLLGN